MVASFYYAVIGRLYTSRSCFATLTPFTARHPADVIKICANMLSLNTSADSLKTERQTSLNRHTAHSNFEVFTAVCWRNLSLWDTTLHRAWSVPYVLENYSALKMLGTNHNYAAYPGMAFSCTHRCKSQRATPASHNWVTWISDKQFSVPNVCLPCIRTSTVTLLNASTVSITEPKRQAQCLDGHHVRGA